MRLFLLQLTCTILSRLESTLHTLRFHHTATTFCSPSCLGHLICHTCQLEIWPKRFDIWHGTADDDEFI